MCYMVSSDYREVVQKDFHQKLLQLELGHLEEYFSFNTEFLFLQQLEENSALELSTPGPTLQRYHYHCCVTLGKSLNLSESPFPGMRASVGLDQNLRFLLDLTSYI